jgi:hypothetical protein
LWHETPFHIKEAFVETRFCIGEGPEERLLCDLRSVPEASKLREQVKNHKRALLRSFSYIKQSWDFFTF